MSQRLLPWLLLAAMVPAVPLHAAEPVANVPLASAKAMELALTASPKSELQAQFVESFMASFAQGIDNDPRLDAMEARKPGLRKAVKTAAEAEVTRLAPDEMSRMLNAIGTIYDRTLTGAEMDAAIGFLRSPTGVRMVERMKVAAGMSVEKMRASGELTSGTPSQLIDRAASDGATASVTGASAEDMAAMVAFSQTPASQKMQSAEPQVLAAMDVEMRALAERIGGKIGPVVTKTIQQHMSAKK